MLGFRDSKGGAEKAPRQKSNLSEPARNRVKRFRFQAGAGVDDYFSTPAPDKTADSDSAALILSFSCFRTPLMQNNGGRLTNKLDKQIGKIRTFQGIVTARVLKYNNGITYQGQKTMQR